MRTHRAAPRRGGIRPKAARRRSDNTVMPRNIRPLPRNTVAKNLSSLAPRRSRRTPRNHMNAMPANGTRFSAEGDPT